MPLFKSSRPDIEADNHRRSPTSSSRKGSIFSSRRGRSLSPTSTSRSHHSGGSHHSGSPTNPNGSTRRGFFHRRSSSASSDNSARRSRNGVQTASSPRAGFFGIGHGTSQDPSIVAARSKVAEAEEAEREADRALEQARGTVREAREHVRLLEREALEDAKRAKAKQAEAKIVSKSARGLGRHG